MRTARVLVAATAVVAAAACSEGVTSADQATADLLAAFTSAPAGTSQTTSSFNTGTDNGGPFMPQGGGRGDHRGGGRGGPNGLPGGHDFMGGGLGPDFLGGPGDGHRPFDNGALPPDCAFNASTGVVTCASSRDGLTVNRTLQFLTAGGTAQSAPDSTTDKVISHVTVAGTVTRRDSATSTISQTSDRTVTGLAKGSAQRTVNGSSSGSENTTGKNREGVAFTAARVLSDSVIGVTVPVADGRPSYPTAGTVIRNMAVTVTLSGQSPKSSTRREVITYDGTSTAKLTITQDGTTKNCTIPLPHGHPTCQ